MNWLLNKRIEIVANPQGYERALSFGQRRVSLAPWLYFLWGYDVSLDMNVLCLRIGAKPTPYGIEGWALDFTLQRRGPPWAWERVRYDWAGAVERNRGYTAYLDQIRAERLAKAA